MCLSIRTVSLFQSSPGAKVVANLHLILVGAVSVSRSSIVLLFDMTRQRRGDSEGHGGCLWRVYVHLMLTCIRVFMVCYSTTAYACYTTSDACWMTVTLSH